MSASKEAGAQAMPQQYSLTIDGTLPAYGGSPTALMKAGGAAMTAVTVAGPYVAAAVLLLLGGVWVKLGGLAAMYLVFTTAKHAWRDRKSLMPPLFPTAGFKGKSRAEFLYDGMSAGTLCYDTFIPTLLGTARAFDFKTFVFHIGELRVTSSHTTAFNKHLLESKFYSYEKGPRFHDMFYDMLGDGIFNSDGKVWKEQRNAAAHLFTSWQLENAMQDVFSRRAGQVLDIIGEKKKEVFDLQALMYCYTFDSIFEIAFGKAVNATGGVAEDVKFQRSFDTAQAVVASRFLQLDAQWRLKRLLGFGAEADMTEACGRVRGYIRKVLDERRAEGADRGATDLISMYEQHNEESNATGKAKVTDEDVIDFIANFTIAGRDTTAALMTHTFYMLATSESSYRERVEQEIRTVDDYKEMHFLQAVLQETLRIWPSVPLDFKQAVKHETLPCGEEVRPGDMILYSHLLYGRNPENFDEPNRFNPDRWMADDGTCIRADPKGLAYPAFNGGPRICLGRHMALLEAKVLLSTILAEYRIDLAEGFVPAHKFQVVLQMRDGLRVTATPHATK